MFPLIEPGMQFARGCWWQRLLQGSAALERGVHCFARLFCLLCHRPRRASFKAFRERSISCLCFSSDTILLTRRSLSCASASDSCFCFQKTMHVLAVAMHTTSNAPNHRPKLYPWLRLPASTADMWDRTPPAILSRSQDLCMATAQGVTPGTSLLKPTPRGMVLRRLAAHLANKSAFARVDRLRDQEREAKSRREHPACERMGACGERHCDPTRACTARAGV